MKESKIEGRKRRWRRMLLAMMPISILKSKLNWTDQSKVGKSLNGEEIQGD
jgi:hypothetical protein